MNIELLQILSPLIFMLIGLATFLLYLFFYSSVKFRFKILGVPFILFVIYFTTLYTVDMTGRPTPGRPPNGFSLIAYIVASGEDGKKIQLWARLKDGRTRLYEFPYDKETEKELYRAMQKQKKGIRQRGEWIDADGIKRKKDYSSDETLLMYDIKIKRTPQKPPR